uniref:Uncharacterized protein n=1 Tax=Candidatus Kentrum sp. DK TaxID=2126562 RepID=A0A450T377_9GAMM|nr:MAG: hypothetical protein BECKDK2373B_GA0170837_10976 [Candidatus Kentron sp. DK]
MWFSDNDFWVNVLDMLVLRVRSEGEMNSGSRTGSLRVFVFFDMGENPRYSGFLPLRPCRRLHTSMVHEGSEKPMGSNPLSMVIGWVEALVIGSFILGVECTDCSGGVGSSVATESFPYHFTKADRDGISYQAAK